MSNFRSFRPNNTTSTSSFPGLTQQSIVNDNNNHQSRQSHNSLICKLIPALTIPCVIPYQLLNMASTSPIKFIEAAMLATGPFALSYTDPDQKLVIRNHLISLLQDFPNFKISTDTFSYNNGATVNLLCLHGHLHLPKSPSVPLTLWVHEDYPFAPPMVFVNPKYPIHRNHPFVDSSGLTNLPYIRMWEYPRSNLLELTRKLVKIFRSDHPFADHYTDLISNRPLLVSKIEGLDELARNIHYDILALRQNAEGEIDTQWKLQAEMKARSDSLKLIIRELQTERQILRERVQKVEDDANSLTNWLKVNDPASIEAALSHLGAEYMFRGADDESETMIESLAADDAIDDVICALEKAVEDGSLSFGGYIKQVRALAREQFFHRAKHLDSIQRLP